MANNLRIGDVHEFDYVVGADKMVPDLYPESPEFVEMPRVFATGFMGGCWSGRPFEASTPTSNPGRAAWAPTSTSDTRRRLPPGRRSPSTRR